MIKYTWSELVRLSRGDLVSILILAYCLKVGYNKVLAKQSRELFKILNINKIPLELFKKRLLHSREGTIISRYRLLSMPQSYIKNTNFIISKHTVINKIIYLYLLSNRSLSNKDPYIQKNIIDPKYYNNPFVTIEKQKLIFIPETNLFRKFIKGENKMAVSWGDSKGPVGGGSSKDIERLKIDKEVKIRLVGKVEPRYVYWVTTTEGKKHPVECLQFNRETESFNESSRDPIAELPDTIYGGGQNEKAQFSYICNVIDRADGKIKLFDLRRTIYTQIIEFARNPDFGNPADEVTGYDITVKKEKTGPLPQNVKYVCMPGRNNTPLTNEEKELELFDLEKLYKRHTYEEIKQWLVQNTTYYAGVEGSEFAPETVEDL